MCLMITYMCVHSFLLCPPQNYGWAFKICTSLSVHLYVCPKVLLIMVLNHIQTKINRWQTTDSKNLLLLYFFYLSCYFRRRYEFSLNWLIIIIPNKYLKYTLLFVFQGLYDMNIEVLGLPLLPWEPPALCDTIKARYDIYRILYD